MLQDSGTSDLLIRSGHAPGCVNSAGALSLIIASSDDAY
jgi:hypothetical protein